MAHQYSKDFCIEHHIEQSIHSSMVRIIVNRAPTVYAPTVEERPQGKWIKIFENPFTNGYVCSFCGHKIQVTEQFLPEVTECESCGADMTGGDTK